MCFSFRNLVQSNRNLPLQSLFFSRICEKLLVVGESLSSGLDILLRLVLGGSVGNEALIS